MIRAIVLLSGGLDSTVVLAQALDHDRDCITVSFNYGQRCLQELKAAKAIAKHYKVEHRLLHLDPELLQGSALIAKECSPEVPRNREISEIVSSQTPPTYVPARNTLFISHAMALAEIYDAEEIHIGVMSLDFSYPDCRKGYIRAFQKLIDEAMKREGEKKQRIQLMTPLIDSKKGAIITEGKALGVPFHLTMSCYHPSEKGTHCGVCDACFLRQAGFTSVGIKDPTSYEAKFQQLSSV